MKFIKKVTERSKVDDKTYGVDIRFYFQSHYTEAGLLYHVEVVILDYDRPIRRIEKYCVLTLDDVGQLNIKNKEYVFNNIISIHPNDLKAEDINIRIL
jgi:hypothetical protein